MKFLFLLQCSVFLIRSANSFHAKLGFVSHRRLVSRRLSGSSAVSDEVPGEEPKKELGELAQQGRKMADMLKDVPVFLVGMMGSGKSTIGDLFARSLGRYTFLDTDDVIEKLAGMSIPEIFESEGEDEFRKVGLFPIHVNKHFVSFVMSLLVVSTVLSIDRDGCLDPGAGLRTHRSKHGRRYCAIGRQLG